MVVEILGLVDHNVGGGETFGIQSVVRFETQKESFFNGYNFGRGLNIRKKLFRFHFEIFAV